VVVIAGLAGGYYWYDRYSTAKELTQADRTALATARVWIVSGRLQHDPPAYMLARDSILSEFNVNSDSMLNYLEVYKEAPERYGYSVSQVRYYVDSLTTVEDSIISAAKRTSPAK